MQEIPELKSIASIAGSSDVWFLDIWGVLHNGVAPFRSCVEACHSFKTAGGTVILVSNAPRPRASVVEQLDGIGIGRHAYDGVVTSGDACRALIAACAGQAVMHIGPDRDVALFDGLGVAHAATAETANVVVCTGLYDDEAETPDDYLPVLRQLHVRGVAMICANPDLQVERGGRIIFCAGAVAAAYAALGGAVSYSGKPYWPIYEVALAHAQTLRGAPIAKERVLAIGDGVATDIEGAFRFGIRSVYVASGVHMCADETLQAAASRYFSSSDGPKPIAVMGQLAW